MHEMNEETYKMQYKTVWHERADGEMEMENERVRSWSSQM
jgi:hypothetical protein